MAEVLITRITSTLVFHSTPHLTPPWLVAEAAIVCTVLMLSTHTHTVPHVFESEAAATVCGLLLVLQSSATAT